jgi:hypothetical protein
LGAFPPCRARPVRSAAPPGPRRFVTEAWRIRHVSEIFVAIASRARGFHPGVRLDFILRQEARLLGARREFKLKARNLTGQDYREFQRAGDNVIEITSYAVGRTFSLGVTAHF